MKINIFAAFTFSLAFTLFGCAAKIPPDQYGNYAFIVSGVPDGAYTCNPREPISCAFIGHIDGQVKFPASPIVVVSPGFHDFGIAGAEGGYGFVALGGHRYIITRSRIYVSMRSDPTGTVIDELVKRDGQYVPIKGVIAEENARKQAAAEAFRIQQAADLPRIRKIGAEVCRRNETVGYVMHAYVEAVSDEKIKLHVNGGQGNDHEIWDFPDLWYLCGNN